MAVPKTAFLVTAHDQPLIARRLLDRLDVPWARTFVHVDRKVDIRPFRAGYSGGATFLPDSRRVPVYWGGFSIAQAMLNMIEYALEEMPDVERVVTLSGVDYPIRPLAEIGRFFARHPDVEFMRVDRDVNPHRTQIHDWYIRRRFLGDNYYFNPKSSPVPALAASARVVARMFPRTYIPACRSITAAAGGASPGGGSTTSSAISGRIRTIWPGSARPARRSSSSSRPASRRRRAPAASPRT